MSTIQSVLDGIIGYGEGAAAVVAGGLGVVGIALAGHAGIALYRAIDERRPVLGHLVGLLVGATMTIAAIVAGWVSLQIVE
jgi:predicted secreted Zn-dependent protease